MCPYLVATGSLLCLFMLHLEYQAKCKARVTAEQHAELLVSGREGFEGRHCLFFDFFSRFSVPFPVCLHFFSVSQQILVSLFLFFSLLIPQLLTVYFYSPLVFTITLLFQVNLIYVFWAFSLHLAPFWHFPSSVFCEHWHCWHCLNSNTMTWVDSKLAWVLKRDSLFENRIRKSLGLKRDLLEII